MTSRKSLGGLFLKLTGLVIFLPSVGFSQGQERIIEKLSWRTEPIKILRLETKGKAVELDKQFVEKDDWLKGLTVTVENTSNKAISRIVLDLSFPRPKGSSEELSTYTVKMIFGRDPSDTSDSKSQRQVSPGDRADVKLLEVNLPFIKEDLERLGYPTKITQAQIMVSSVTFSDGSMWAGDDTILYPDPNNPGKKIDPRFRQPGNARNLRSLLQFSASQARLSFGMSAFGSTNAPSLLTGSEGYFMKPALPQNPTDPCNTVHVTTNNPTCGGSGSGCTRREDVYDDSIELLGLRNARKMLDSVRCIRSDGTFCTTTPISNFRRLPCGVQFTGCPYAPTKGSSRYPAPLSEYCCNADEAAACRDGGGEWNDTTCTCTSPVLIDLAGDGFDLTDAANGVIFDIHGNGVPKQVSWTSFNSDDAWLALDRNGNGLIDDGSELFGSATLQTPLTSGASKNGFRALALLDSVGHGGNHDGLIDARDSLFSSLKLWQDRNHNGLSEADELQRLADSEVVLIELRYKEAKRRDENGNWFRYRAKIRDARGEQAGRWAWDVFLQLAK